MAPPIALSSALMAWAPIVIGFLVMFVPTYWDFAHGIWNTEEQGHGPLILVVFLWLIWQARLDIAKLDGRPATFAGTALLIFGLLMYVLGRSQQLFAFEIGSQIPILAGAVLLMRGWGGVRLLYFPLLFLVFMVPWPGLIVDFVTAPLKQGISEIAERVLYLFDYPIARTGVILTIGPYQLLVADACSGIHSIISLSALGFLYLYLMKHTSFARNAILVALVVPIAMLANVTRVMVLVLVTFHMGDEAGQGFVHGFAGMVLFVAALLLLFLVDAGLGLLRPLKDRPQGV
jgi:exosortase B